MKRILCLIALISIVIPVAALATKVYSIRIDGIIDPAVAGFVKKAADKARDDHAQCLVIGLNTPGGMLEATKEIVQDMLNSDLPVVVFVSPRGASATSAGMMITIGAHVAVMAPGTNIGAAHPVMMPFGVKYEPIDEDDTMMKKATEDTAGWVRSIAETRGRNADWVEQAVRQSSSITASEAVQDNVVDGMAGDFNELLDFLNGRVVTLKGDSVSLNTRSAQKVDIEMSTGQKLQHYINNPNVILILLLLGALGIAVEFKAPGMIFPGVIGAGCILVALLAPSLPINVIGLLLVAIGFVFLIAEVFMTSYGLLAIFGIVSLVVGTLMLFETQGVTGVQVDWYVLFPLVIFVAAVILIVGTLVVRAHQAKVSTGKEDMIGLVTEALTDIAPSGRIFLKGEYWNARSDVPIKKGEMAEIVKIENLICFVKKAPSSAVPEAPKTEGQS